MNPLKVVTQKHPRLAMIRDVRVVDHRKAPPVAQDHQEVATHHPDDAIAHVTVVKVFLGFLSRLFLQYPNFIPILKYFFPLYTRGDYKKRLLTQNDENIPTEKKVKTFRR